MPEWHPVAEDETEHLGPPLRRMLHGRCPGAFRIPFSIEGDAVTLNFVRHGAQGPIEDRSPWPNGIAGFSMVEGRTWMTLAFPWYARRMATELGGPASKNGAAILGRLINPDDPSWSPEAARSILELTFPKRDKERVEYLLAKNQDGQLTQDERAELDEYLRADAFLSVLKSKARLSLKRAGSRA